MDQLAFTIGINQIDSRYTVGTPDNNVDGGDLVTANRKKNDEDHRSLPGLRGVVATHL